GVVRAEPVQRAAIGVSEFERAGVGPAEIDILVEGALEIGDSAAGDDRVAAADDAAFDDQRAGVRFQRAVIGHGVGAGVEDEGIGIVGVDHAQVLVDQRQTRVADGAGAGNRVVDVGDRSRRAAALDRIAAVIAERDGAAAVEREIAATGDIDAAAYDQRSVVQLDCAGLVERSGLRRELQNPAVAGLHGGAGVVGNAARRNEHHRAAVGLQQTAAQIEDGPGYAD